MGDQMNFDTDLPQPPQDNNQVTSIVSCSVADPNPDQGPPDLDPDPHQNVMDPEHWCLVWFSPSVTFKVMIDIEGPLS